MKNISKIFFTLMYIITLTGLLTTHASAEDKIILLEPGATCITSSCHANMGQKKYIHAVGVDGKQCIRCHEISKEGEHRFTKLSPITKPICAKCHSEEFPAPADLKKKPPKVISDNKGQKPHQPFAEGKCTLCHNAHESNFYRQLKLPYPPGTYAPFSIETYSLCISCHKNLDKVLTEPRTLSLTQFRNGNLNLHFRHVNKKKGRTCTICHHPHSTKNPKLLKDTFQFGNRLLTINYEKTETGGKCATTCHRIAIYDRYKPVFNLIKTSPRPGIDATEEELKRSRQQDMKRQAGKIKQKEN